MFSKRSGNQNRVLEARVPSELQKVFVDANNGLAVHEPPAKNAAARVFFRAILFKRGKSLRSLSSNPNKAEESTSSDTDSQEPNVSVNVRLKQVTIFSEPHYCLDDPNDLRIPTKKAVKSKPGKKVRPQDYLDRSLRARGYSTARYRTLKSAYYNKPTPLQRASYGLKLIHAVRDSEVDDLKEMMTCGLSPNPSNAFGESLVHMVCKRGEYELLKILVAHGADLQVADDNGRTPLHDACWSAKSNFDVVDTIVCKDPRLFFMMDRRGALPLSYVKKDNWDEWVAWIGSNLDKFWSYRDQALLGDESPPPLTTMPPQSRPVADPPNALPIEIAALISSGAVDVVDRESLLLDNHESEGGDDDTAEESVCSDGLDDLNMHGTSTCCRNRLDFEEIGSESVCSWDEDEIATILTSLSSPRPIPIAWSK